MSTFSRGGIVVSYTVLHMGAGGGMRITTETPVEAHHLPHGHDSQSAAAKSSEQGAQPS